MTPLHLAVNAGSIRIVSKLLKLGVKKENKDEKGRTPLDLANSYRFKNIIKLIMTTYSKFYKKGFSSIRKWEKNLLSQK